ncbi:MAG: Transcriptional regulator MntR [Pelotomaculum sp. PtaB.Bin104]|nr:MAG: Transcriptional regulator MntR [Pelotomaculum sp. PtaB.Bin104]
MEKEFYTFSEYMKKDDDKLTASMEDYLEMIYRLSRDTSSTRILDLAAALNIQPPSATRMVQKLADINLVNYEKYGMIILSEKGREIGNKLLERHQIIEDFLRLLGISENILEETEKIEHTISKQTLECMTDFVSFFYNRPEVINEFKIYRNKKENFNNETSP